MDLYTAQTNKAVSKMISERVVADGGVALRIRCVAYPESSSNYADAVLVSATSLTLSINGSADSTVGSSGVLAFATYTTLGALVDAINASSNWKAEIVAGLRSDSTGSSRLLARSTSTFRMYQDVELKWDSSVVGGLDFVLEPAAAFASNDQYAAHRVSIKRLRALVNTSDSSDTNIVAYEVARNRASTLKTITTLVAADNTEKDSGAADEAFFTAEYGNAILVRFLNGSGWADSGAYLEVQGARE